MVYIWRTSALWVSRMVCSLVSNIFAVTLIEIWEKYFGSSAMFWIPNLTIQTGGSSKWLQRKSAGNSFVCLCLLCFNVICFYRYLDITVWSLDVGISLEHSETAHFCVTESVSYVSSYIFYSRSSNGVCLTTLLWRRSPMDKAGYRMVSFSRTLFPLSLTNTDWWILSCSGRAV